MDMKARTRTTGRAEIILNLWFLHDDTGTIYSLRARAYVAYGSDEEKLVLRYEPAEQRMLRFLLQV